MSCFIVDSVSVRRMCITVCGMSMQKRLPKTIFFGTKEIISFFRYMYMLNFIAYASRYNDEPSKDLHKYVVDLLPFDVNEYKCEDMSVIQLLKSLDCLYYQCEEDIIDKKQWMEPTLKKLKELRSFLMRGIIEKIPEYKDAKWG